MDRPARPPHSVVVMHAPSDSRCNGALAQRRRQKAGTYVAHPVSGARHKITTPAGTFPPVELVQALESVRSGHDPEAVMKLVEPYRLDGPNPRPDVLSSIFAAMTAVGGFSRKPIS